MPTAAPTPMLRSTGAPSDQPLLACDWIRDKEEPLCNGAVHYVSTGKASPSPPLHLFKGKKGLWQIAPEVDAAVAYAVAKSPAAHPNTVVEGEWLVPTPPDGSWQLHKDFHLRHDGPNTEAQPYEMDDLGADFFLRVKNNKLIWYVDPATGETMHSGAKAAGSKDKPGQRYCPLCRKCFSANNFVSQHLKNLHTPPNPGAPLCAADANGGAVLTWQVPTCPQGARPIGYAVQFSLDHGATWTTAVENTGSPEPRARIEPASLIGGRSYTFRVAIHTLACLGAYSSASTPFVMLRKSVAGSGGADGGGFPPPIDAGLSTGSSDSSFAAFAKAIDTPLAPGLTKLSSASFGAAAADAAAGAATASGASTGSSPRSTSALPTPPVSPPPSVGAPASLTGQKRGHSSSSCVAGVDSQYGSCLDGGAAASASSTLSSPALTVAPAPGAPPGMIDDDDHNLMWTLDEIISCASSETSPVHKKVRQASFGAPLTTVAGAAPPPAGGGAPTLLPGESLNSVDLTELLAQFNDDPQPPIYRSVTPQDADAAAAAAAADADAPAEAAPSAPSVRLNNPKSRIVELRGALHRTSVEQLEKMITPQLIARYSKAGWTREVTLLVSYAPPKVIDAAISLELDGWGPVERAELRKIVALYRTGPSGHEGGIPASPSSRPPPAPLMRQNSAPSAPPRNPWGTTPRINLGGNGAAAAPPRAGSARPFGGATTVAAAAGRRPASFLAPWLLLLTLVTAAFAALAASFGGGGVAARLSPAGRAPACHWDWSAGCVPSNRRTMSCTWRPSALLDNPCEASR